MTVLPRRGAPASELCAAADLPLLQESAPGGAPAQVDRFVDNARGLMVTSGHRGVVRLTLLVAWALGPASVHAQATNASNAVAGAFAAAAAGARVATPAALEAHALHAWADGDTVTARREPPPVVSSRARKMSVECARMFVFKPKTEQDVRVARLMGDFAQNSELFERPDKREVRGSTPRWPTQEGRR